MRSWRSVSLLLAGIFLVASSTFARVSVRPHGVAVAPEDDPIEIAVTLSNDGDEAVTFEVNYEEPEDARLNPGGPRRDQPEGRFAVFQDLETFGWVDQWVFQRIEGLDYDPYRNAQDLIRVRLEDYDALWVETGNQSAQFRQNWDRNQARFEEYVDRGGVMFIEQGHNEGGNVSHPCPGGLNSVWDPQEGILNVGPDENWLVQQMRWQRGQNFPGNSFTHVTYPTQNLENIENSDWYQVIVVGSNNRNNAIVIYNYGRGWVIASGSPCGHQWRNHNIQGRWGSCGENLLRWMGEVLAKPAWVALEPEDGEIGAGEELELTMTFLPEGMEDGVYELFIDFELDDPAQPLLRMTAVMSVGSPVAQISGTILDAADNSPIEGAQFYVHDHYYYRWTDEEGRFSAENIPVGAELTVTFSAPDYLPITQDIVIEEEGELEIEVALLHSRAVLDPDGIVTAIEPDQRLEIDIELSNIGNGPLTYSTERQLIGDANAEPWTSRRVVNVGQAVNDERLEGVEFFNDHFYVSGAHGGEPVIYVYNRDGEPAGQIVQPQVDARGMRDIAWDGELIWGSIGRRLYGINLDGEIVAEFDSPYNPNICVAWDGENEFLWVCGTTTNISAMTRDGERIRELNRRGLRIYGLGWYPDDPDGYYLYVSHREAGTNRHTLHKFNPENGDTMRVGYLDPPNGGDVGGVTITNRYDVYSWVMLTVYSAARDAGGDRVDIWQVDARKDWMAIDPDRGVVEAGQAADLTLTLDATGLPTVRFEGQILFKHDGVGGESVLPITLDVVEGRVHTQRTLRFNMGWNLASLNLVPDEDDVPALFAPLVQAGILERVKDGEGRFFAPGFNFNNIPGWMTPEGYWVKVSEPASLVVEGESVLFDDPIELTEGWQIISYYPRLPVDVRTALAGIGEQLLMVKDELGNFYVPRFDFSNMAPMREGDGYMVKMREAAELVYQLQGQAVFALETTQTKLPRLISPVEPTGENMSLLVMADGALSGEVGVYAGERLVGSAVMTDGRCGLAIWGDDPTTAAIDGARMGESLTVRFINEAGAAQLSYASIEGEGIFTADGFWAIHVDDEYHPPTSFGLFGAYPNPFNNASRVLFGLNEAAQSELKLFDLTGRLVWARNLGTLAAGTHTAVITGDGMAAGVYLLHLRSGSQESRMKLTLVK